MMMPIPLPVIYAQLKMLQFSPIDSGEKVGHLVLHKTLKSKFIIGGRQKTSATHIMHAFTRALARMWLSLNEEFSCPQPCLLIMS